MTHGDTKLVDVAGPKPGRNRVRFLGGLMRCCVATLDGSADDSDIGSELRCVYCATLMRVGADGAWARVREGSDG